MTSSVANTIWARAFVDELARSGLREVLIAPGSRSTPLVMACAGDARLRTRVHLDERSLAFFALGIGKATGRPAAVVTTSGTAVANLFPAVVEAFQSGVPLLVLSADRPHRLRGADANQAIDQVGIFGSFVRAFHEMSPATVEDRALRHLRTVACRAYGETWGTTAGPVHVNFPFDKPLEPAPSEDLAMATEPTRRPPSGWMGVGGRPDGAPFVRVSTARPVLEEAELEALLADVDPGRGVIVAGPMEEARRTGPAVVELASATGFPLLADPLSGARYGPPAGAHVVAGYDLFLGDDDVSGRLAPTLVVRVGATPTSASLQRWLFRHAGVDQIVVDGGGRWKDHGTTASRYAAADAVDTLRRLGRRWSEVGDHAPGLPKADLAWADRWLRCDDATRDVLAVERESGEAHEGEVAAIVVASLGPDARLVVSSSMPIRDVDAFGHPRSTRLSLYANRGASGIDGVVSTAFGLASQGDGPVVCLIGDVAFFHDANGLLWSREADAQVIFVLVDNDGGGIFHRLPIADHDPEFTRLFVTPHGVDPRHAAAAHGIRLQEVAVPELGHALTETLEEGRTTILRVRSHRERNHRRHREVEEAVQRSVRETLG